MSTTAIVFALSYLGSLGRALTGAPIWGMYAYIAAFYVFPPGRWWGPQLPEIRWSLVAAVVTLLAVLLYNNKLNERSANRPSWLANPIAILIVVHVAYMYLQWTWVESRYHTEGIILFTKYLALFYVIYRLVDTEQMLRNFLLAHFVGCAYFGYLAHQKGEYGRLESVGGPGVADANTLGMHLSTGVLIGAFMLLTEKGIYRIGILLGLPLIINGIILTQSRGAFLGLVFGCLVTIILKPPQIKKVYWTLGAIAVLGFLSLAGNALFDRVQDLMGGESGEEEIDTSAQSRIAIAEAQLKMFTDYPAGVGFRGTTHLSRQYIERRWLTGKRHDDPSSGSRSSHNTLLSALVNEGVIGILLYLATGLVTVVILFRIKAMDRRGLPTNLALYRTGIGGALGAAFAAGQTADYTKAEVQIWLLAALVVVWQFSQNAIEAGQPDRAKNSARPRPGRFRVA